MNSKLDALYRQYLDEEGDGREEVIDELLSELAVLAFGSQGERYRYVFEGGQSAIGPAGDRDVVGLRVVVDPASRTLGLVATLEATYLATIAIRALAADPQVSEHGYRVIVHCLFAPERPRGRVLLEGGAYDKLLTLFHTPPDKVWVAGQGEEANAQANAYVNNPETLKQAIVENMRWQLEQACGPTVSPLPHAVAVRLSAYADAFQGLMHFASSDEQWEKWVSEVRPAWVQFERKHPYNAGLLENLETRLARPVRYKAGEKFQTVNTPSLLRRD